MDRVNLQKKYSTKDICKFIRECLLCFAFAFIGAFLISQIMGRTIVSGTSMLPTYQDGQSLLLLKHMTVDRNDVVVTTCDNEHSDFYIIKRVIAVPGDTLKIEGNNVLVNDKKITEDYIKDKQWNDDNAYDIEITLNESEYYVMGDNRNHSMDSRVIGPIDGSYILGTILDV